MLVREWMTAPPLVVSADLPASRALRQMDELRVRRFPVEEDGWLVGLVTRGDLQTKLGPVPMTWRRLKLTVRDVMSPDPLTIGPDETLDRAAEILLAHKISGLPVVENGKIVGILTESDLFRAFREALNRLESARAA